LYTRTGNVPAMCFTEYTLPVNPALYEAELVNTRVRPLVEADAPICAQINQSDPVHYLRQAETYRREFYPGGSWMVEQDGKAAAYLLMRIPWEFMDDPQSGVREVNDFAGSREAIVQGLKLMLSGGCEAFNPHGIHELRLAVAWQEAQFGRWLEQIGPKSAPLALPGHTMRLIDFPALRADLAAYITARLPQAMGDDLHFEQSAPLLVNPGDESAGEGRCAITWQHQRLELSTAEMTQLVMGTPDQKPAVDDLSTDPDLVEIVRVLFPLPSFQPGLNYR
jgi:hypothetical protein